MAGSRREKIGSIFARMTGLLRSGAVKEEDRPLWYDVVKALPPKPHPPPKPIINILYPEDFVRVHFYNTFVDPGAAVLTNEKIKSVPQRFVDKYLELQAQKAVPTDQLFDETVRILKEEGVRLITHQEREASNKARMESVSQQRQQGQDPHDELYNQSKVKPRSHTESRQPRPTSQGPKVDVQDLFKENT